MARLAELAGRGMWARCGSELGMGDSKQVAAGVILRRGNDATPSEVPRRPASRNFVSRNGARASSRPRNRRR